MSIIVQVYVSKLAHSSQNYAFCVFSNFAVSIQWFSDSEIRISFDCVPIFHNFKALKRLKTERNKKFEMASFGGHSLPGTFFLIFAFWNTLRATLIHTTAGNVEKS